MESVTSIVRSGDGREPPPADGPSGMKFVPAGWTICRVKDIARITTGAKNTQDKSDDGAFPFFVRSSTVERINSYSFDGEAVLTAGDGVGTGKVFHYINGKFDFHQRVYKITDFSGSVDGYYFYLYFSTHFYDRIMAMTAKSSVDSVRMEMIADMPILLPPLPEQRAIAEALSDVDSLITALNALIAKKRAIKLATMQQLLTGRTRLPGFEGEWERKRLGEGVFLLSGHHILAHRCNIDGRGVPYLTGPSDFPDGVIRHSKYTEFPMTLCRKNDILVTVKGSGAGSTVISDSVYCISRQLMAIRATEWDSLFVYYSIRQQSSPIQSAATGLIPGLSRSDILDQVIAFPSVPEQQAISAVLSDMDAEIEALEARVAKTRDIKQGMMQQLLTGRIRLVTPASEEVPA